MSVLKRDSGARHGPLRKLLQSLTGREHEKSGGRSLFHRFRLVPSPRYFAKTVGGAERLPQVDYRFETLPTPASVCAQVVPLPSAGGGGLSCLITAETSVQNARCPTEVEDGVAPKA